MRRVATSLAVVAAAVVAAAVVVVIVVVVVVVVGLGFKHGEQRRRGVLRERENETTVLCVHRGGRMKLTLCGERIDEIYYILCVLKCILEKGGGCSFFLFFLL